MRIAITGVLLAEVGGAPSGIKLLEGTQGIGAYAVALDPAIGGMGMDGKGSTRHYQWLSARGNSAITLWSLW